MSIGNIKQTGVVFNIQKFSVNDGPGIRTVVFLKGCPLHCKWCANPESQSAKVQILWNEKNCVHCHHCLDACPQNAIASKLERVQVSNHLCNGCLTCVKECMGKALTYEGEIKTVQEVMDVVLQDRVFYEESGGGITLSGGELFVQPQFAKELLIVAKENGLHTCCETTGYTTREVFQEVIPYIDEILFDLKHYDSQKHIDGTGVSNTNILANMHDAVSIGKNVLPRLPVIPGFNDSLEDALRFVTCLNQIGVNRIQLLPFHQFGENKYHLLNKEYAYESVPALHKEDLFDYQQIFINHGINAFF